MIGDMPLEDPSFNNEDIPRKFNETLTDWAIRCQVLRRYQAPPSPQAPDGETLTTLTHIP